MFTIFGTDGKEYGPVTAGKVIEWMQAGRANAQTKIKRVGDADWTTIGALPEFGGSDGNQSALSSSPPPAGAPAAAAPAPAAPLTGSAAEIAAGLNARAASLDIFSCLGRSFDLWKSNFLPLVGVTLLIMIIQFVAGLIPILGMLSGLFLNGVFYGGLYYYYLGKMRGEPREVSDAFAGFTKSLVPLILANLLTTVIILAVLLVSFGPMFLFLIKAMMSGRVTDGLPDLSPLALGGIGLGSLVILYLAISWVFTFALVIDKGLGPWTAMEVSRRVVTRQWFRVFFVMLLGGILAMLGLIGLIIGVFLTIPLAIGAVLYAYEDLCNPPAA